ncbi:MAG: hypothetical protein IJ371_02330 [Clostridia bacterium]|nr:hypothetical protein [Clostridia bacterium]
MGQYIINLFQDMSLLTTALLIAGVVLCIVEIFVPKIGLTGIFGAILMACAMSSYYTDGYRLKHFITLISFIALILAVCIMIELVLESKGVIKNPHRYRFRTYNVASSNLNDLVGKSGKAISNIDLGGTVEIDGQLYYATSDTSISKGSVVQVIGVQNNALVVKK